MEDGRVAPPQVNYDNVLPLAIESRSNRREFLPINGQSFSNATGATICRIDVNADSMLDATHSYLECDITNNGAADNFLALNNFSPAWIQRLRIESGGVVIEDINEYSRLYSMLTLAQCPKDYVKNNMATLGLYKQHTSVAGLNGGLAGSVDVCSNGGNVVSIATGGDGAGNVQRVTQSTDELIYSMSADAIINGTNAQAASGNRTTDRTTPAAGAFAVGGVQSFNRLRSGGTRKMCIPLVSGWLNMSQYIPLIMMNAGFTIELTLCDANRIGITQTETAAAAAGAKVDSLWTISNVRYVAHLIDLDRSFYDRLRMVMDDAGGVLQLAGQTYRHFSGLFEGGNATQNTIALPARVKSVKSIFGTFIRSDQMGVAANYDTCVFQRAGITSFRFEIGSVRYPQTDVSCNGNDGQAQREAELDKAFGKIGDYQHQKAYSAKHTTNDAGARTGDSFQAACLSAFMIGYDFEAFNRVMLEQGIDTASRSLPINVILNTDGNGGGQVRGDFFVLCDAVFFVNLDGTASVSV
jgi:hypothetical protein